MKIIDKHDVLKKIEQLEDVRLELGCGSQKKEPDAIGIDSIDYECVDIVGDVFDILKEIPDATVSKVYSSHFMEHVSELSLLMCELERVLVPNGILCVIVPHFSSPYYYSDYTHQNSFGLYSFSYFAEDRILTRQVPTYDRRVGFILENVSLIFKSPVPFYFRYAIKRFFQLVFNLNSFMKEFYEENLCYLIPCYEIKYELKKTGSS